MAFFKKVKKKLTGLWYPEAITVGKPVTTDQVADRLALISTVSRGDTYAVLKDLGEVMASFMAEGRTVKLRVWVRFTTPSTPIRASRSQKK